MDGSYNPIIPIKATYDLFDDLSRDFKWIEQAKVKGQRLVLKDGIAYDLKQKIKIEHPSELFLSAFEELNAIFGETDFDIVYLDEAPNDGKIALIDIPSSLEIYEQRHFHIKFSLPCASALELKIKYDIFALPSNQPSYDRKLGDMWADMKENVKSVGNSPFSGVVLKHADQRYETMEDLSLNKNRWMIDFE